MRQFYNTAESPEMAIFQFTDTAQSLCDVKPSASQAIVPSPSADQENGQSSCKNPQRLSLANLLPSRLDYELKDYQFDSSPLVVVKLLQCRCI